MNDALPKLLAPPAVIVTLLAGTWFWGAVVAPGYYSAIGLVIAWFVLCSVFFGRIGKARPQLRWWLRGTFLACSVVSLAAFYFTSVRDTVVDEALPEAVPASQIASEPGAVDPLAPQPEGDSKPAAADSEPKPEPKSKMNVIERTGAVTPEGHSASGTARVVKLAAGGRRLTLSDGFEIDPGPQVQVYLATDSGGGTFKDLGGLRGSRGDQSYEVPAGIDLDTYDTVVFWCVPFTTSLASAELRPA